MLYQDNMKQIDEMQQAIQNYGLISTTVLNKINYKFRLEWNYTSNSMEGNSLTRSETRTVMTGNITVHGKPIRDILEIKGHDEVIRDIIKMGKGELNISEKRIKDIHKAIMHEENPELQQHIGKWKTSNNYLTNYKGERFDFVDHSDVKDSMHNLINWLNAEKDKIQNGNKDALHPVELAFRFHLDYITIHPFYDGNGRTCRILTNLILISYGYPPFYVKENELPRYYQYLADIQGYGSSPEIFYEFMAELLIRSLQIVIDAVEGKDIDEPDDLDKEISLLKVELSGTEDILKERRSGKAVMNVIGDSIFPLLTVLDDKLKQFEELFFEVNRRINYKEDNHLKQLGNGRELRINEFRQNWLPRQQDVSINELTLSIELKGFKKTTKEENIWINMTVVFTNYHYQISDFAGTEMLHHPYDVQLTEEEIGKIVKRIINEVVIRIKGIAGLIK